MPEISRPGPALRRGTVAAALATALLLGACATSAPVVNPTGVPQALSARAQQDVVDCSAQADRAVGRNGLTAGKAAGKAGSTAAVGFAGTAVGSIVARSSDAWDRARGAAAGGATGMATKLLLEWNEGDDVYRAHVERCLERRGHEVLGWR
jgi:hypothetical protein